MSIITAQYHTMAFIRTAFPVTSNTTMMIVTRKISSIRTSHQQYSRRRRRHLTTSTSLRTVTKTASQPKLTASGSFRRRAWQEISNRPIEFLSVPCVAAFVGILTNWMGVKMLFYPVEYQGLNLKRWDTAPYGLFGWQGVVPCKTDQMAKRLVKIITEKLLSLDEAFDRLDSNTLGQLLLPGILESVEINLGGTEADGGRWYAWGLKKTLPWLMPHLVTSLKQEIDQVLNLEQLVLTAFVRDKSTLINLFQKVGRVELDFLVNSGFGLGFVLGIGKIFL